MLLKNVNIEANLFAVSLLFDEEDFNIKMLNMSNYLLKQILDYNIEEKIGSSYIVKKRIFSYILILTLLIVDCLRKVKSRQN